MFYFIARIQINVDPRQKKHMVYLCLSQQISTSDLHQVTVSDHPIRQVTHQVIQVTAMGSPCLAARLYHWMAWRCNVERF